MVDGKGIADKIVKKIMESLSSDSFDPSQVVGNLIRGTEKVADDPFSGFVDEIAVSGIRSYGPRQTFRLSRGLTVIYADNGVGKTSLTDALELNLKGRTSRTIAGKSGVQEVQDQSHIPHVRDGQKPADPKVDISWYRDASCHSLEVSKWSGRYGFSAESPAPIQVFSRRRLRENIDVIATDRAEQIGISLGLEETISLAQSVRKNLTDKRRSVKDFQVDPQINELIEFVESRGGNFEDASSLKLWADEFAQEGLDAPSEIPLPPQSPPQYPNSWALLVKLLSDIESVHEGSIGSVDHGLVDLLTALQGIAVVDDDCPACRQGTLTQARLHEIEEFLSRSKDAIESKRILEKSMDEAISISRQVIDYDFCLPEPLSVDETRWENFPDFQAAAVRFNRVLIDSIDSASELRGMAESFVRSPSYGQLSSVCLSLHKFDKSFSALKSNIATISSSWEEVSGDLKIQAWVDLQNYKNVASSAELIIKSVRDRERNPRLEYLLGEAIKAVRFREEQIIHDAIDKAAPAIEEWMGLLAPENTPEIGNRVRKTTGRVAWDLMVSGTQDMHAAGFLSDSQLDMLGLSAHLAILEMNYPGQTIVLDDPSDMLDRSSTKKLARQGVAKLLGGNGEVERQVVILTHDDRLVKELWDAHRNSSPMMMQYSIQDVPYGDQTGKYAALSDRSTNTSFDNAREFEKEIKAKELEGKLWVRASFAGSSELSVVVS